MARICLAPLKFDHLLVNKFLRIGGGHGGKTTKQKMVQF